MDRDKLRLCVRATGPPRRNRVTGLLSFTCHRGVYPKACGCDGAKIPAGHTLGKAIFPRRNNGSFRDTGDRTPWSLARSARTPSPPSGPRPPREPTASSSTSAAPPTARSPSTTTRTCPTGGHRGHDVGGHRCRTRADLAGRSTPARASARSTSSSRTGRATSTSTHAGRRRPCGRCAAQSSRYGACRPAGVVLPPADGRPGAGAGPGPATGWLVIGPGIGPDGLAATTGGDVSARDDRGRADRVTAPLHPHHAFVNPGAGRRGARRGRRGEHLDGRRPRAHRVARGHRRRRGDHQRPRRRPRRPRSERQVGPPG